MSDVPVIAGGARTSPAVGGARVTLAVVDVAPRGGAVGVPSRRSVFDLEDGER